MTAVVVIIKYDDYDNSGGISKEGHAGVVCAYLHMKMSSFGVHVCVSLCDACLL